MRTCRQRTGTASTRQAASRALPLCARARPLPDGHRARNATAKNQHGMERLAAHSPPRGWSRSAPQAVTHPSGSCGRTSWIFCSAHRHVARPHCSPAIAAPAPLGSTAGQPRCAGRPLSPAWDLHVLRKFSPQPPRRPPCRPCHVLRPPRVAFQLGARLLWTRAGNLDRPLYLTAGLCRYSPEWTPPGKGAHPVQKKGQYLKFNVEECALFLAHILY